MTSDLLRLALSFHSGLSNDASTLRALSSLPHPQTNDAFGFRIAELRRQCHKGDMTTRAVNGAHQHRASLAWAVLLSMLLVFVNAYSRPSGLSVQPTLASIAAVQGVESPVILLSAAKVLRAPDLRQACDPDDAVFACAFTILASDGTVATALCSPGRPDAAAENCLPEPRAPPFA